MLIDEAFNGKGLDEVVYCFQPNVNEQQARASYPFAFHPATDRKETL